VTGAEERVEEDAWSVVGRIGYTFVPYGKLQQGTEVAENPNQLGIDVHLGTLQMQLAAPTGTALDVQLPFGSLLTSTILDRRTDHGIGDLELRLRQRLDRWLRAPATSVTAGLVVPTGPYVARSGAANLPPEASFITLGRGVPWLLAEADGRLSLGKRTAVFAQVGARVPVGRTADDFAWGTELRAVAGLQVSRLTPWLSVIVSAELQWRAGASEPDPFSMERLTSANVGGTMWSVSPAVVFEAPADLSIIAGARIPLRNDVTGNQLVPGIGGFIAVSYAKRITPRRDRARTFEPPPSSGERLTIVDYWATWCKPCSVISRLLDEAAGRWPDVRIVKVDANDWPSETAPALPAEATGLPAIEILDAAGRRVVLLQGDSALRVVEIVDKLRQDRAVLTPAKDTP